MGSVLASRRVGVGRIGLAALRKYTFACTNYLVIVMLLRPSGI